MLQFGTSDSNELQALIKRKMMDISDHVFLLMDSSKFGVRDLIHLARLDQINTIITDEEADAGMVESLKKQSIQVIQPFR